MKLNNFSNLSGPEFSSHNFNKPLLQRLHLEPLLLTAISLLSLLGLVILYSAASQNQALMMQQVIRLGVGCVALIICAQIPPWRYRQYAPYLFSISLFFVLLVLVMGKMGKGAERWLNLGFFTFQPSELMKITVPLMLAWYLHHKNLPPNFRTLLASASIITIPVLLIMKQPDLGTSLMIAGAGLSVLFFAGLSWRLMSSLLVLVIGAAPLVWLGMHDYQRQRVLTFLNPEDNPLSSGYHIIQSKIAIGSGGLFGKGWLNGSQAHLSFLPEHATDFIFAVNSEEFGFMGNLLLILLFLFITGRSLYISTQAQDTFSRLLVGGLSLSFFLAFFTNIGMVIGLMPVVGLPLPLISYGGTSVVTVLASFGIMMSIHTHRKLVAT